MSDESNSTNSTNIVIAINASNDLGEFQIALNYVRKIISLQTRKHIFYDFLISKRFLFTLKTLYSLFSKFTTTKENIWLGIFKFRVRVRNRVNEQMEFLVLPGKSYGCHNLNDT